MAISISKLWHRLAALPGGKRIFSIAVGRMARYTGTTRPQVLELGDDGCRVRMRDRAAVRNHLGSIHAVALVNLAEVTTGLALLYRLPDGARAILVALEIEYVKKARGTLQARASAPSVPGDVEVEIEVGAEVTDAVGEVVARATARWRVGPAPVQEAGG